jgi:hypothetical protein
VGAADSGSTFRINGCQYIYNLDAKQLGPGVYEVAIEINRGGWPASDLEFWGAPSLTVFQGRGSCSVFCGVFEQYLLTNRFTKQAISANIACDTRI